MAGYSGTPLAKKLGIRQGHRVTILDAPNGFARTLAPLPEGVSVAAELRGTRDYDVIVWFVPDAASLARMRQRVAHRIAADGGLWLAWPKQASGVETDLSFDLVRRAGLGCGLVDNKVCAVDETYSGLRFVVRREHRPRWADGDRHLEEPA